MTEERKGYVENTNYEIDLRSRVQDYIFDKKKEEATELLVKHFLKDNYIYTTRDDRNGQSEMWIYREGIYVPHGRSHLKEFIRLILQKAYNNSLAVTIVSKVEEDTKIDSEDFFNQKNINKVPVENGVLDIFKRELKPFDPHKIFFSKIPVKYEPSKECPNIEKFFSEIVKKEDVEVLYEIIAHSLLKEYKVEKGIMLLGDGRNGKGKYLSLIARFFGKENCSSVPLNQMNHNSSAVCELFNRFVNLCGDLSNTDLKDTGLFKQLTGRDKVQVKRKFLRDLIFENYATMIFACNELPKVYDLSLGFWTRWILLQFPNKFLSKKEMSKLSKEEKKNVKLANTELIDQISTPGELSGLLNKVLISLMTLIKKKDFSYTSGTAEVKETWIRKSNSFTAFCMDCLEEAPNFRLSKKIMRQRFAQYCKYFKLKGAGDKEIKATLQDTYGVIESREWDNVLKKQGDTSFEGVRFKEKINSFNSFKGFLEHMKIHNFPKSKNTIETIEIESKNEEIIGKNDQEELNEVIKEFAK